MYLDDIPKTLMKEWHINSTFQLVLKDHTAKHNRGSEDNNKKKSTQLNRTLMSKWKRAVAGKEGSRGKLGQHAGVPPLNSTVDLVEYIKLNGKTFTTKDRHPANSLVEFYLGKDQQFGEVEQIF